MSLSDYLSHTTLAADDQMAETFQQARPFSHLVVDNFFNPTFCEALLSEFPAFDDERAKNENGTLGRKATYPNIRDIGPTYQKLDTLIKSREFLDWVSKATGIDDLIYDPDYFGGGTHENCHGQDLDPHVDFNRHPVTGHHRRLNLIVYLNHEWSADWGGAIEFHTDPRLPPHENAITEVAPLFNRCVIFATHDHSWHGFKRISLPAGDSDPHTRKSVALYFYTKTRPAAEYHGRHSTIYIERPLPEHIRPGQLLSEQDYQQIQALLARRDQHLARLYRDNHRLQNLLDNLTNSRTFQLARRGLNLAWRAKKRTERLFKR
ncbi:2OG-Fe(II) oxygenase [Gilvimarinus algae]|uniref:2OG-Fe(II) oxygenase n=1 Tax=Gilvimarinus algae TaxID=3058037 RepID=A0ABT8TK47_9GAMM|nr:2OG-Fe(II) oxygenase [Gilvimarinus sp. SDUM040014]MDO3383859.1 2OG-Fe(II) oxygenase [Gilvimarinus sp. SDUM040014]